MKFTYTILELKKDGWATVEYKSDDLGTAIHSFFLPIHRTPEQINNTILRSFPREVFLRRQIQLQTPTLPNIPTSGEFDLDLEDMHYDLAFNKTKIKRQLFRYPDFLVWVFQMNRGDVKTFAQEELTRNLDLPSDIVQHKNFNPVMPLFTIPIFTEGSFIIRRRGKEDWFALASQAFTYEYLDVHRAEDVAFIAREDSSEYHCLVPRSEPCFWKRKVSLVDAGPFPTEPDKYYYLAKGRAEEFGPKTYRKASEQPIINFLEPSIIASVWK
jgi:hypothetical protein